jgi:hypothetical protein
MNPVAKYLFNQLYALDLHVNTILGGSPRETISARLGRNYPNSWITQVVNWLASPWDNNDDGNPYDHCQDAAERETPDPNGEVIK